MGTTFTTAECQRFADLANSRGGDASGTLYTATEIQTILIALNEQAKFMLKKMIAEVDILLSGP